MTSRETRTWYVNWIGFVVDMLCKFSDTSKMINGSHIGYAPVKPLKNEPLPVYTYKKLVQQWTGS